MLKLELSCEIETAGALSSLTSNSRYWDGPSVDKLALVIGNAEGEEEGFQLEGLLISPVKSKDLIVSSSELCVTIYPETVLVVIIVELANGKGMI
jgi:hypothetical protein